MNDLGYGQLSNPNRSLKLVLMRVKIIGNSFSNISTTLAKDFIASHSFESISSNTEVDDPILITQSSSWTSCHIQYDVLDIPWLGIRKS